MKFKYAALLLLVSASLLGDDSVNPACKTDKRVVAACFKVYGRLSNWNGNPTRRIWIIGTKRVLGIREDTELPRALTSREADFDNVETGDFEVCPLTRERKGWMQIVCVASASHVKFSKRNSQPTDD
jgi:hypothetical protein